jgi:phosphonate transport system substrate-binding protein
MKRYRSIQVAFQVLLLCIALAACNSKDPNADYQPAFAADTARQNTLVMGWPNFSYSESAAPLLQYLNAHLSGMRIKVQACVNWEEYVKLLSQGKFDITLSNGMVSSEATNYGYSIYGKITGVDPYSSLIVTRKNSDIGKVTDLKGKKVALVPSNIIPATMMGMYYLYQNGLDVNLYIHKLSVASFEAGIISVYLGESDAGICARRNWNVYIRDHPEVLSKVQIKWETPALEQNAVLIKNTVDEKMVSQLMSLFFSMHDKKDAKTALEKLGISGFEKADRETYKPMMDFKKKYDSVIF